MHVNDVRTLLRSIVNGSITAQEIVDAFDPVKQWSSYYDQTIASVAELQRTRWQASSFVSRSIEVKQPVWNGIENPTHFANLPRRKPERLDNFLARLERLGVILHKRDRLDLTYSENAENLNDKPAITKDELKQAINAVKTEQERTRPVKLDRAGRIDRKRYRKLRQAEVLAALPDATSRAIDRYAYVAMQYQERKHRLELLGKCGRFWPFLFSEFTMIELVQFYHHCHESIGWYVQCLLVDDDVDYPNSDY